MPGPFSIDPSRVTRTSVPSGNTVSRCALNTRCGPGCAAGALAEDVTLIVDPHVSQAGGAESVGVARRAGRLLERRRGNLAEPHLFVDRPRLVGPRDVERGANGRLRASDAPQRPRPSGPSHVADAGEESGHRARSGTECAHASRETLTSNRLKRSTGSVRRHQVRCADHMREERPRCADSSFQAISSLIRVISWSIDACDDVEADLSGTELARRGNWRTRL